MSELTLEAENYAVSFPDDFAPRVHDDLIVDYADDTKKNVILLHPDQPRWALTNSAGLAMARSFDGHKTIAGLTREICAAFLVEDPAVVLRDVRQFVHQLYGCNLLANAPLQEAPSLPEKKRIPSVTIYVTEECNLRCKHCSIVDGKMPETLLTGDDIRRIIDQHTSSFDNPTVAFLGGEPLLRPDCIDLLAYACARTRTVNMSTNGFFVDEEMAARISAIPVNLQVSLDGADPEVHDFIRGRGSFVTTWAAIERLAKHGGAGRLTIATTLTKAALPQIKSLIETCDRIGIGKIRFLPLDKSKAALRNWDRIAPSQEDFERATRYLLFDAPYRSGAVTQVMGAFPGFVPNPPMSGSHWCPLGETLIVNSQGQTYNCPLGTSGDTKPIGNIFSDNTASLLDGEANRASRERMLSRRFAVEECRSCGWRNFCQGGCSAFMAHRSGSFLLNDTACEFRRNLYREHVLRKSIVNEREIGPEHAGKA